MSKPARLDAELVRRGLAGSRAEAKSAIEQGKVAVRGVPASRATTLVSPADPITLAPPAARFVSRGGHKLDGALARLAVEVAGRRWLDAGASTGGFTDRLLQGGAAAVVAADVGYGQLDWSLRNDDRVVVIERLNLRELTREHLPWTPEGVVADLSFISLRLVLPTLAGVAAEDADFVVLVKPQFEVGRDAVGKGGVVRDSALWVDAMRGVAGSARGLGLALAAAVPSRVPGPAGNREFFLHLRAGDDAGDGPLVAAAQEAAP
ncbi:MAG TPA: TlyA family RNA methyltransferase [Actinomycetota bacterium]|nr:TlyA family RNA methyltransferase [Actinomycetota bacterium]